MTILCAGEKADCGELNSTCTSEQTGNTVGCYCRVVF